MKQLILFAVLACAAPAAPARPEPLARDEALWLNRVTYGLNTAAVEQYRTLGRHRFLELQLRPGVEPPLSPVLRADMGTPAGEALAALQAERQRINALPEGPDKEAARKKLNEFGNGLAYQAARTYLVRAIYGSDQLREQLVWFWLNHFSVYQQKADLRWLVGDYEENAIRPHALGRFRDLVLATLTHPAMLQYLDNAQNAAGHVNENYARELMELHTLGVNSGYTQQDVQELARILTGAGVSTANKPPTLKPEWQRLYRREGAFEFNPARHDFGAKVLLGQPVAGRGFDEITQAIDLLVRHPACARFISRQLAVYFVSDEPPPGLVERMARAFQKSDGDITAVLRTMFTSREFPASLGNKFKDPVHYVIAALRMTFDDKPIRNAHPVMNWLNALGEPLFGRQTPDGYPLTESGWASSGQLSRRLEIARAIGTGSPALFEPEDGTPATVTGFPRVASRLYFEAIEPYLSRTTGAALDAANSQQEWNTFVLASPEANYR